MPVVFPKVDMAAAAVVAMRHRNKSVPEEMVHLEEAMPREEACIKQDEIGRQVSTG